MHLRFFNCFFKNIFIFCILVQIFKKVYDDITTFTFKGYAIMDEEQLAKIAEEYYLNKLLNNLVEFVNLNN